MRRLLCLLLFSVTALREGKAESGNAEKLREEGNVGETGRYRWGCTARGETFREVRV